MAIDTSQKRFSMMGFSDNFEPMVDPSGSVDAATRATFLNLYEGIALNNPAASTTIINQLQGPNLGADLFNGTLL